MQQIEKFTTSLQVSRTLREMGAPQESTHFWYEFTDLSQAKRQTKWFLCRPQMIDYLRPGSEPSRVLAAFTRDELHRWINSDEYEVFHGYFIGEVLDNESGSAKSGEQSVTLLVYRGLSVMGKTEADALGRLLIGLIKEGDIDFDQS